MTDAEPAAILAAHDLRVTEQRTIVLEALVAEPNDVTAQTLHERLRPANPKLGIATVYRTLNTLADAGVLDRLNHGHDAVCYRFCGPGHHHHLTCRDCHAVIELHGCDLDAWATEQGRIHGFQLVQHTVELDGICLSCSQAPAAAPQGSHA